MHAEFTERMNSQFWPGTRRRPQPGAINRRRQYRNDMSEESDTGGGWFVGLDPGDKAGAREAVTDGRAEKPQPWPSRAVSAGFAESEDEYYERLRDATIDAARAEMEQREQADDQQLVHAVRALDDCRRLANELTERVAEWAGSHDADATVDADYIRELTESDPGSPVESRVVSLAQRTASLHDEVAELERFVEETAETVAPNLSALAGPELAARLVALAGSLDALAKKPSGTVQLLGAENALFAHLRGGAPSPKHGIIYTHEYVRGTPPDNRGSAARALAGKLTIAARIDHYSGDYRPELEAELDERIERIRARDSS